MPIVMRKFASGSLKKTVTDGGLQLAISYSAGSPLAVLWELMDAFLKFWYLSFHQTEWIGVSEGDLALAFVKGFSVGFSGWLLLKMHSSHHSPFFPTWDYFVPDNLSALSKVTQIIGAELGPGPIKPIAGPGALL